MKKIFFVSCALCAFILASCCGGKTSNEKQPVAITAADVDSVSYMMGYSFGMQIKEGNFGGLEYSGIMKGMKDAASGIDVDVMEFRRIVNSFLDKRRKALAEEMLVKSAEFLEQKRVEEGVDSTMTGLLYKIIREGEGPRPMAIDTVEVNYEGTNLDGKVFDSSYERGNTATFPLEGVIKGWTEGLQLVGEGGEIMLYIPASMAYGEYGGGNPDIRPNEALTFRVELLKVKPFVPRENK